MPLRLRVSAFVKFVVGNDHSLAHFEITRRTGAAQDEDVAVTRGRAKARRDRSEVVAIGRSFELDVLEARRLALAIVNRAKNFRVEVTDAIA